MIHATEFAKRTVVVGLMLLAGAFAQQSIPSQIGNASLTSEGGQRSQSVSYGMTVSSIYDDNAGQSSNGQNNVQYLVQPQFSFDVARGHSEARLFYGPGVTYSTNVQSYNRLSQVVGADLTHLFTKRLSLHLQDSYLYSSNPFDAVQAVQNTPSLGLLDRPNAIALGTDIHTAQEQGGADLIYALGRHTSVGAGGTYVDLKYKDSGIDSIVIARRESRSWSGHAFYSQQVAARTSVGVQYAARNFDSPMDGFSTRTHEVLGFYDFGLTPAVHLSFFGGPQFSTTERSLFAMQRSSALSWAGGAVVAWQGQRNGFSANFTQQITDAGLFGGGAVQDRSVGVQAQRQLGKRTTLHGFFNYINSTSVATFAAVPLPAYMSAGASLSRSLAPHVELSVSGLRQQFTGNSQSALGLTSHDTVYVSLSYQFQRPVGK